MLEAIGKGETENRMKSALIATEKQRLDWLDALRALAMLFVMYGHLFKRYHFFLFTSPIKIPLFFAISGYLLYGRMDDWKSFLRRLTLRVVVPWLILSFGFGLRFVLTQGFAFYANYAVEVLLGKRLWYIACCIIAQVLFYVLQRLVGSGWKLGLGVVLLTASGLVMSAFGVGDLLQFRTALICQFFLLIGYWFKKYEDKLSAGNLGMGLGMLGVYIALAIGSKFLFPRKILDVHTDVYYNIPYCFLLITVGCVALFACARHLQKIPRWLCFIGQNTLVFYIHATFWTDLAKEGLSLLKISLPKTWWGMLILLALSCIGCAFEAIVLNKIFPEANGKKRKKKAVEAI